MELLYWGVFVFHILYWTLWELAYCPAKSDTDTLLFHSVYIENCYLVAQWHSTEQALKLCLVSCQHWVPSAIRGLTGIWISKISVWEILQIVKQTSCFYLLFSMFAAAHVNILNLLLPQQDIHFYLWKLQ